MSQAVQSLEISNSPKAPSENGLQQLAASPDSVLHSHPPRGKSASQGATDATQSGRPGQLYNDKPTVAAGGEDEDNWQKASSSHNAARKKKRKQQRRCAVQAVSETSQAEPASSVLPEATVISSDMSVTHPRTGTDAQTVTNASEASQMVSNDAMATTDAPTKASSPETSHIPPAEQGITGGASAACSQSEDEESASSSSDASDDADSGSEQDYSDDDLPSEAEDAAAAQSSVASVTADFAMQNVILQMGLRLVAPNGMRIKQLSRWVLRCSACFKITKVNHAVLPISAEYHQCSNHTWRHMLLGCTCMLCCSWHQVFAKVANNMLYAYPAKADFTSKAITPFSALSRRAVMQYLALCVQEPGRLFCPHCGNSTLEKVEAVIGPDGTEQYGVRKRFNTRGTRYSLPKPKVHIAELRKYLCLVVHLCSNVECLPVKSLLRDT